jgi:hypothetical protein
MNECTQLGGATATTNGTDPVGTKIDEEDVENGTPWCMKSVAEKDEFEVRGGTCKEAAREIRFILDSTTAGACTYGRVAAIVGEITTDEPEHDATVLLKPGASTEMTKKAGGILCPASGNLEMEFTLETDEATAKPVYFSK